MSKLDDANRKLAEMKSLAQEAGISLKQLEGALEQVIRRSAYGGSPTSGGTESALSKIMSGTQQRTVRAGGGSSVFVSKAVGDINRELDKILTDVVQARVNDYMREMGRVARNSRYSAPRVVASTYITPEEARILGVPAGKPYTAPSSTTRHTQQQVNWQQAPQGLQPTIPAATVAAANAAASQAQQKVQQAANALQLWTGRQGQVDSLRQMMDWKIRKGGTGAKGAVEQTLRAETSILTSAGFKAESIQGLRINELKDGAIKVSGNFKNVDKELRDFAYTIRQVNGVWGDFGPSPKSGRGTPRITPQQAAAQLQDKSGQAARQAAIKAGFDPNAIEEALVKGGGSTQPFGPKSNITRYRFAQEGPSGERQSSVFHVTKNGEVLDSLQKQYRSFGEAIRRDISEVTKWGLAVGLVYGTFQKLQELVTQAIENESRLLDVTIALGNAQKSTNQIFSEAASVARATGESIDQVLEGYVTAYRAAGQIANPVERATAANKLLADSLTLSKLAGIEQAKAMDILSAALKQTAGEEMSTTEALSRGNELLDKWVALTKIANVDLETLATTFSIVSEQAENAGVSTEELNAIIAILSEKLGGLSPEETGNKVRAVLSSLYSPQGAEALQKFGVAVEDSSGRMRNALDIVDDINRRVALGLISVDQLNKLTYTVAGGVRNQSALMSLITGSDQIPGMVAGQMGSAGIAGAALETKMSGAQTAITNLNTTFAQLAQTIGDEGGILTIFKDITVILDYMVRALDGVTKAAGSAGPALAASIAAMAYFSGTNGAAKLGSLQAQVYTTIAGKRSTVGSFRDRLGAGVTQYGGGIAATALSAIQPFQEGGIKSPEAWGTVAGGILGTVLGGGNPIWAAAGAAFGSAAARTLKIEYNPEDFLPPAPPDEGDEPYQNPDERLRANAEAVVTSAAFRDLPLAAIASANLVALISSVAENMGLDTSKITGQEGAPTAGQVMNALAERQMTPEEFAIREAYNRTIVRTQAAESGPVGAIPVEYQQYAEKLRRDALSQLQRGTMKSKGYADVQANVGGAYSGAYSTNQVVGDLFGSTVGLEESTSVVKALMDVFTLGSIEASTEITKLTSDLNALNAEINDDFVNPEVTGFGLKSAADEGTETGREALREQRNILEQQLLGTLVNSYRDVQKSKIIPPSVVDMTDLSDPEANMVLKRAQEMQWNTLRSTLPDTFNDSDIQQYIEAFDPFFIQLQTSFQEVFKLDPKYLEQAKKELEKLGKIAAAQNLNFAKYGAEEYAAAKQYYEPVLRLLESKFGYKRNEQPTVVRTDDGQWAFEMQDSKVMQMLMEELVDLNRQQLDGIYNLPANGSFYVPYSESLRGASQGGGGGVDYGALAEFLENLQNAKGRDRESTVNPVIGTTANPMTGGYYDSAKLNMVGTTAARTNQNPMVDGYYNSARLNMLGTLQQQSLMGGGIGGAVSLVTKPGGSIPAGWAAGMAGKDVPNLVTGDNSPSTLRSVDLNLRLTSSTQVIVDGKVLTETLKTYFADSLINYSGSSSTVTKTVSVK